MTRHFKVFGLCLGALIGVGGNLSLAQTGDIAEMVLGRDDAPVTIIEYASMSCPHCAAFHEQTLPALKTAYIDTGKVKLVFREFPFDDAGLRAAMLARCAGPERYFGFIDVLFKQQQVWSRASNPVEALGQIARIGGMGDDAFRACIANRKIEDHILRTRLEGQNRFGVNSTPTFIIGDKKFAGSRSFEEMKAVLDPLLGGGASAAPVGVAAAQPAAPTPAPTGGDVETWLKIGGVVAVAAAALFLFLRRRRPAK